jgi:hypothetical protein
LHINNNVVNETNLHADRYVNSNLAEVFLDGANEQAAQSTKALQYNIPISQGEGTTLTEASNVITLDNTGNVFQVVTSGGAVDINTVTKTADMLAGIEITLINNNASALTFKDGVDNLALAGDFVAGQWDTIKLVYIGSTWYEVSRSNN